MKIALLHLSDLHIDSSNAGWIIDRAHQVAKAVNVPLIGMGGISCAEDAIEFLLAGASAVAVGTANFNDPTVTMKICDGISDYLAQRHLESVQDIIGAAL